MKCRSCGVLISQADADAAAELVDDGHETLCGPCAAAMRETDAQVRAQILTAADPDEARRAMLSHLARHH